MDPGLPGDDLIEQGIADLERGVESIAGLVVSIGSPRLQRLGLRVPPTFAESPEHRLYAMLASSDPDGAHARYNSLIRRLVSYERAAECVS